MSLHSLQVSFGLDLVLNEPSLVIRYPLTLWQFIFIFLENYNAIILINWQSFSAIGYLFIIRIRSIIQVLCLVMVGFFLYTGICKQSILESSILKKIMCIYTWLNFLIIWLLITFLDYIQHYKKVYIRNWMVCKTGFTIY